MIGLIVPSLSDPFFSQCAHAAQQVATGQGRQTTRILLPTGLVVRQPGGCEPMARIQNHG